MAERDAQWWREYRARRKVQRDQARAVAAREAQAAEHKSAAISAATTGRAPTSTTFAPGDSFYARTGTPPNMQHGARTEKRVAGVAEAIERGLLDDPATPDYLRQPAYAATVTAWSRAEAVAGLLWDWLSGRDIAWAMTELSHEVEDVTAKGPKVRRVTEARRTGAVLDQFQKANTKANDLRKELGLTPLSRARLGKDVMDQRVSLGRIWAEMDEAERKKAMAGEVPKELPSVTGVELGPAGEDPPAAAGPPATG